MRSRLFAWVRDFYAQYRMPNAILRNHVKKRKGVLKMAVTMEMTWE